MAAVGLIGFRESLDERALRRWYWLKIELAISGQEVEAKE